MALRLSSSIGSDDPLPEEFVVLKLAERFHKLPHEVREMPEADYRVALLLFGAEAEARQLKGDQAAHHKG